MAKNALSRPSGHHQQLELFSLKEVEIDGVGMGVLNNGTPYLTLRGLARMCGVDHAAILRMANDWPNERAKPRGKKISELLAAQGHNGDGLFVVTKASGRETHAYIDTVCMAVLEYYAFEASQGSNEVALKNYRLLARSSFRMFIYNRCGYDPRSSIPESWRNFHARILMNDTIPVGYFSVFREIADLVIHMIQCDCLIDDQTVPDISVGQSWAKYWNDNRLGEAFGERMKHGHNYPEWFPQSNANPVPAWIYPVEALGEFRVWIYEHYVTEKFPAYLKRKVSTGYFLPSQSELVLTAVTKDILPRIDNVPKF